MGFYLRDEYGAEHQRSNAMRTAADRDLPEHLRGSALSRGGRWLSVNAWQPAQVRMSIMADVASSYGGRYWRRMSGRVAGLVLNTVAGLVEHVPGRTKLA